MEIRVDVYYSDCEQCRLHYLRDTLLHPNGGKELGISQVHLDHLAIDHNVRRLVLTVEEEGEINGGKGAEDGSATKSTKNTFVAVGRFESAPSTEMSSMEYGPVAQG
jgi:hypothetical protein